MRHQREQVGRESDKKAEVSGLEGDGCGSWEGIRLEG